MRARGTGDIQPTGRSGVIWVAAGAALWGADPVVRRLLTGHVPPTHIVAAEHVILSVILLPVLWRLRSECRRLGSREWVAILGISWGASAVATVLFTEAIRTGNPTTAVLLQKVQPLGAAVLARLLLREPLNGRFWLYAALAASGAYMITVGQGLSFRSPGAADPLSALFALGAAFIWGASTVLGRLVLNSISFPLLTALRFLIAMPLLLAFAAMGPRSNLQTADVPWLLVLALLPGLAALLMYYRGLSRTRASHAAIAELSFPAATVLLNWIVWDVQVTPVQAAGFVLLWCVIFHLQWSETYQDRGLQEVRGSTP